MHCSISINLIKNSQTTTNDIEIKEERKKIYCGLKERWWKQIFDGVYHNDKYVNYGPKVFDLGSHKGPSEPGYYLNVKRACEYACEHLLEKTTLELYKKVHQIACSHFDVIKQPGEFNPADYCVGSVSDLFQTLDDRDMICKYGIAFKTITIYDTRASTIPRETLLKQMEISEEDYLYFSEWKNKVDQRLQRINDYITKRSKMLGASKPIARLQLNPHQTDIKVIYYCSKIEAEQLVATLFAEFAQKINNCTSDDEKITCISDTFQVLEWIHPFRDGQGRTDLIMLGKWLTENGLNPSILDHPYVSTYNTLEDWADYLKKGIATWRKEAVSSNHALSKPLFVEENQHYWNETLTNWNGT